MVLEGPGGRYELAETARMPAWSAVDGLAAAGPDEHEVETTWFDTAGQRLAAAGVALWCRRGGAEPGWGVSLPEPVGESLRVGFARGEAKRRTPQPPAGLVALLRAFTRDEPVAPVARVLTEHRSWRLSDGRGGEVLTIVEERSGGDTLGPSTTRREWREVDLRPGGSGDGELVRAVERRLRKAGGKRRAARSPLARTLGRRLGPRPASVDRGSDLGTALLAYLREQAAALAAHDPAVRRDLADAVHQMRVATRRLRSALRAYRDVLEPGATGPLDGELRWIASVLGPARDAEVLEERLRGAVAALPSELVLGPVDAQLTRYFAARAAAARAEILAALDGERYLTLLADLDALLADPPLTGRATVRGRRNVAAVVARAHRRVDRALDAALREPPGEDRDLALHAARKAAKRLRYAVEVAAPVLGKRARSLLPPLKQLQDVLGDHQDAAVSMPVLRELGAQAGTEGGNGFTFGLLYAHAAAPAPEADLRERRATLDAAVGRLPGC